MLEDLEPIRPIRSCKIRTLKEGLDSKDQLLLDEYLADPIQWTPYTLARALGSKGLKIDHRQIVQHRELVCTCKDIVK